jgi:hypothetical protein
LWAHSPFGARCKPPQTRVLGVGDGPPQAHRRVRGAFHGPVLDKPLGNLRSNQAKQDRDHEEQPFRSLIPRVRLFRLGRVRLGIVLLGAACAILHEASATEAQDALQAPTAASGASAGRKAATGKASPGGSAAPLGFRNIAFVRLVGLNAPELLH